MCKGSNEQSLLFFVCMNFTGVWGCSHQKRKWKRDTVHVEHKNGSLLVPQDASLNIDNIKMIQSENDLFWLDKDNIKMMLSTAKNARKSCFWVIFCKKGNQRGTKGEPLNPLVDNDFSKKFPFTKKQGEPKGNRWIHCWITHLYKKFPKFPFF